MESDGDIHLRCERKDLQSAREEFIFTEGGGYTE